MGLRAWLAHRCAGFAHRVREQFRGRWEGAVDDLPGPRYGVTLARMRVMGFADWWDGLARRIHPEDDPHGIPQEAGVVLDDDTNDNKDDGEGGGVGGA